MTNKNKLIIIKEILKNIDFNFTDPMNMRFALWLLALTEIKVIIEDKIEEHEDICGE